MKNSFPRKHMHMFESLCKCVSREERRGGGGGRFVSEKSGMCCERVCVCVCPYSLHPHAPPESNDKNKNKNLNRNKKESHRTV